LERYSRNLDSLGRKEGNITNALGMSSECVSSLLDPFWKETRVPLPVPLL